MVGQTHFFLVEVESLQIKYQFLFKAVRIDIAIELQAFEVCCQTVSDIFNSRLLVRGNFVEEPRYCPEVFPEIFSRAFPSLILKRSVS